MGTLSGLVIDDEPQIRTLFAQILRTAGMRVIEAQSGTTALALADAARPDFVVTDLEMPDGDGLDVCRWLRNDPELKDVVIVMVSGAGPNQREEAISAGCDVVLSKPCSPELLVETTRQLLANPS